MLVAETESRSETETLALGSAFGRLLHSGDVVVLQGDLGAGKTVFARGVAAGLGCDPAEVQSPTFTLVREYDGETAPVHHLDIYRLEDPENQLEEIGFEAYFDPREGVSLIEWGDKASALLPASHFEVTIRPSPAGRRISIVAKGAPGERAAQMRERLVSRARRGAAEPGEAP